MTQEERALAFDSLVAAIRQAHSELSRQAGRAVNIALTLRNWLIGMYIREYEQCGRDRASYGEGLLDALASALRQTGVSRCDARELRRYRLFYITYPQIRESLPPGFRSGLPQIGDSGGSDSQMSPTLALDGDKLVARLSFTHFVELLAIEDALKRSFYEIECIRGNWSVRELKRQIASLYYERSALSHDKKKLSVLTGQLTETNEPALAVRDPYVFEFLGLKPQEVVSESNLEVQLIEKLQDFLLELGNGFCFEARQKRILIGGEHFFVDLVFYHRILKCHVLVELKLERFTHENIGQLNTYVSWWRQNMMAEGDNPPIGILLCTEKNNALAEYALAGMDNSLFVSKYMLGLPRKEDMQAFLERQVRSLEGA
ncbi:MAG: DUF1016 family protein [Ottowia sp.]|nr:DUF1016 family protein [Ottowia sp.]